MGMTIQLQKSSQYNRTITRLPADCRSRSFNHFGALKVGRNTRASPNNMARESLQSWQLQVWFGFRLNPLGPYRLKLGGSSLIFFALGRNL